MNRWSTRLVRCAPSEQFSLTQRHSNVPPRVDLEKSDVPISSTIFSGKTNRVTFRYQSEDAIASSPGILKNNEQHHCIVPHPQEECLPGRLEWIEYWNWDSDVCCTSVDPLFKEMMGDAEMKPREFYLQICHRHVRNAWQYTSTSHRQVLNHGQWSWALFVG